MAIIYSDFQCPACRTFARETLPRLRREYVDTGKLLLAFRSLPLEQRHPGSRQLAALAYCADLEGKFWEAHDLFTALPEPVTSPAVMEKCESIGLASVRLSSCAADGAVLSSIDRDVSQARVLHVDGTPTFLFGQPDGRGAVKVGRQVAGAPPTDAFIHLVDDLLRAANT